jgi:hypothetical protein
LLSVAINRYEAVKTMSDSPTLVKSRYLSGTREIPNPEYVALQEELEKLERAMARDKWSSDTEKAYTRLSYSRRQTEFNKLSPTIEDPVYVDYEYAKVDHTQRTNVDLTIVVRDLFTREKFAEQQVTITDEMTGVELRGVSEDDISRSGQSPVEERLASDLPDLDQQLHQAERKALDQLAVKVEQVVPTFTERFFRAGKAALEKGRSDEATEFFLCHWAFFRGRLDEAEMGLVWDAVKKDIGFDVQAQGPKALALINRVAPAPR